MPLKHESHENSDECDSSHRLCDELSEGEDQVFEDPEKEPLRFKLTQQDQNVEESNV